MRKTTKLNIDNFEILEIRLAASGVSDLNRVFGPSRYEGNAQHEGEVARYCSPSDKTVLEFDSFLATVTEFRLYEGPLHRTGGCTNSSLVSKSLRTASGLGLGMSRDQVIALLGPPTKTQRDHCEYDSSYERPRTADEIKHAKDVFITPPVIILVSGHIDITFQGRKAVRLEVIRTIESE